jgi:hypothetical protein
MDAARQEEEEEHAGTNLRKVTIKRRKKGLCSSTKINFMRLRNGSYLAWMNVFLLWSSKELTHVFWAFLIAKSFAAGSSVYSCQ